MSDGCCPPKPKPDGCCPPPKAEAPCCPPKPVTAPCCPPQTETTDDRCPPTQPESSCCPPAVADDRPGYKLWPFVCGWLDTPVGRVPRVATRLTAADITGRWQMRWGLGRNRYSIAPGLYAIGSPHDESPVLVTANYKMTFDILRRDLDGRDAWLLVLDTRGINVWCAAGKGTFGTAEIVRQVLKTGLENLVSHRTLIVPQLGAPGVAAHRVQKLCGFKVIYGPVRSSDLPQFLDAGLHAAPAMRRVTFSLVERLVLTPVELVNMRRHILWSLPVLLLFGGIGPQLFSFAAAWQRGGAAILAGLAGLVSGAVLAPVLLPWLPGRTFAFKGAFVGAAVAFSGAILFADSLEWLDSLALLTAVPAIASWCAMHFTGSSTFTSPSGVEKEMRKAIPAQASALLVGGLCWIASAF